MSRRAEVIKITPRFIREKDALAYLGISESLFRKIRKDYPLSTYGFGPKIKWYKLSEIDAMMEDDLIIQKQIV